MGSGYQGNKNMELYNSQEIKQLEIRANTELQAVGGIKIKTAKDIEDAKEILNKIAAVKKEVLGKKNGILKPINEAVKNIRALFAPIEEKIEKGDMLVRSKMLEYSAELKKKIDEQNKKLAPQVASGKVTFTEAAKQITKVQEKKEAIPIKKIKEVIITDRNLIPDDYWIIDVVKLRRDVLAGLPIPGTKVGEREIISR